MNVDAFLKYKNEQNIDMIQYIDISSFNPTLPLNIVICPAGEDLSKNKNLSKIE